MKKLTVFKNSDGDIEVHRDNGMGTIFKSTFISENGVFDQYYHLVNSGVLKEYEVSISKELSLSIFRFFGIKHPEEMKIGRPKKGETKKISVTAPADLWETIDNTELSRSQFFKNAAEFYLMHLNVQSSNKGSS